MKAKPKRFNIAFVFACSLLESAHISQDYERDLNPNMSTEQNQRAKTKFISRHSVALSGVIFGLVIAIMTSDVGRLSTISDNSIIGAFQKLSMIFIMPGLLGSAIISDNVHAYSFLTAAACNLLIYSFLGWLAYLIFQHRGNR